MDERRALMAAIIANPDEDTPRLALADWLQENGDKYDQARAEFIRCQIEASNAPPGNRREELLRRVRELEKKHLKKWLAPLGQLHGMYTTSYIDFNRGLVTWISCDAGDFLSARWQARLPDALAAVGVEELSLFTPTKRIALVANSPAIRWVARLQYPEADDAALAAFARSENFAHLSGLTFHEVKATTDAGLRDFAKHTRSTGLTTMEISFDGGRRKTAPPFSSKGVLALLKSARLPRLKALTVGAPTGTSFGLRGFLANPALQKLERLSIQMEVAVAEILTCKHLTGLRALHLTSAAMNDADTDALLASRTFAKLEELNVHTDYPLSPEAQKKLKKRFGDNFKHDSDFE